MALFIKNATEQKILFIILYKYMDGLIKNIDYKLSLWKEDLKKQFSEKELYKQPVYLCSDLWYSSLYKFCQKLNKGADLHVHGGAMIPADKLIDFLWDRDDVLIDTDKNHRAFLSLSFIDLPKSYITVRQAIQNNVISREELIDLWTLKGKPNKVDTWDWFQELFDKHNDINEVGPVCYDYFKYAYRYYCSINVSVVEMRLFLLGSLEEATEKLKCVYNAYLEVKKEFPMFCVRVIPVGLKNKEIGKQATKIIFNNTINLYSKYNDNYGNFITGIDLVNEEDAGFSLLEFKDEINDVKKNVAELDLFLHAGETKNPNNNQIEIAVDFEAKRIGHALNLNDHLKTKEKIKEKNICLEICPLSNLTLGYIDDMRKHPGKSYFYENLAIALCSDDPTYQEHNTLVDDFFMAIISWDLSFLEIQQLCKNSILYSSISRDVKTKMLSLIDDNLKIEIDK